MWAIRVLTGPQAGQVYSLKKGKNLIGRAPHCDFKIVSSGISKEHIEIQLIQDKIALSDLKSSNGTFVNGIKIQNSIIRMGDKVSMNDIVFEVIMADEKDFAQPRPQAYQMTPQAYGQNYPNPQSQYPPGHQIPGQMYSGASHQFGADQFGPAQFESSAAPIEPPAPPLLSQWKLKLKYYIDEVALPGLFSLPNMLEYRLVILSLIAIFVVVVTFISMFPTARLSNEAVVYESQRRAQSLARILAQSNQESLLSGQTTLLSTMSAENEEGVKEAYIVQHSDGMILAPATRAGRTPQYTFIHEARREGKSKMNKIDGGTVGASFPISVFNPNTGEPIIRAHAVVIYDMSARTVGLDRLISLFMQNLMISSVFGLILFFFLYRLIEYPLVYLNKNLDAALREKTDNIQMDYQYPILQNFLGNLNSLLSRYFQGNQDQAGSQSFMPSDLEVHQLVKMVGYPCAALGADGVFLAANDRFEGFSRMSESQIKGQPFSTVQDASFSQNIGELMGKARMDPSNLQSDQLEFNGLNCEVNLQAFQFHGAQIQFFLLTITPIASEGEEAAS